MSTPKHLRSFEPALDGFCLLATLYLLITTPYRHALHLGPQSVHWPIEILASGLLAADAFYGPKPLWRKILALLGALPFEFLFVGGWILRIVNILHLGKLPELTLRLDRSSSWMRPVRRMMLSLAAVVLLAHWVACGWLEIGGIKENGTPFFRYTAALYWSITTMATVGYGDIVAHSILERWYALLTMLVGIGFFGYIVGNVASILASIDRMGSEYRERMERIRSYMRFHRFPSPLRKRIEEYSDYVFDHRLGFDDESFLKDLPNSLRAEIAVFRHREVLRKVPFLQDAAPKTLERLAFRLKPQLLRPNDLVFRRGDRGDRMYFINRGSVEVLGDDETNVLAILQEGAFFGEMALLNQEPRNATIRSLGFCELVYLEHSALEEAMRRFPDFAEEIRRIASLRSEKGQ